MALALASLAAIDLVTMAEMAGWRCSSCTARALVDDEAESADGAASSLSSCQRLRRSLVASARRSRSRPALAGPFPSSGTAPVGHAPPKSTTSRTSNAAPRRVAALAPPTLMAPLTPQNPSPRPPRPSTGRGDLSGACSCMPALEGARRALPPFMEADSLEDGWDRTLSARPTACETQRPPPAGLVGHEGCLPVGPEARKTASAALLAARLTLVSPARLHSRTSPLGRRCARLPSST
eukprot:CAMPEP_0206240062 /NCGR_PEP_ID=MMETSP0047_2-20121206/15734_1 /ASSEMBLY_ACC=CAM_ASM_000192 /TAXON_ID=195065 /ORGANISM="Chroomonas mesostigmatica_cf, Strain CCMP1168" /LENGTH=236 /DNA_ID=CAMNT_0053664811 /DNA_START=417 /DNA_END=1123 /DNA_ORIENTATION=-